jgi:hypothetical protein
MKKWAVGVLILLSAAAVLLLVSRYQHGDRRETVNLDLPAPQPRLQKAPILYPVPQLDAFDEPREPAVPAVPGVSEPDVAPEAAEPQAVPAPLPRLDGSDARVQEELNGVLAPDDFSGLFFTDSIVRRFVATVDNLTRDKLPRKYVATRPTADRFRVGGEDSSLFIDQANYDRYTPFVEMVAALDSERLVSVYVRLYPLFQKAYEDLGYPKGYFNDRLVEVIEHLLQAPQVRGPVRLVRPHVLYRYADPQLEALSSGQKILVRIGADNALVVKRKLQEIVDLLKRGAREP